MAQRRVFGKIASGLGAVLMVVGLVTVGGAARVGALGTDLVVSDMAGGVTAQQLAQALVGAGVTVSNVTFAGDAVAAGSFTGGSDTGFTSGIVLSSGRVKSTADGCSSGTAGVEGPNTCTSATTDNTGGEDTDLELITTGQTSDATVLEFDFVPQFGTVSFHYVFGSEEYNEYANTSYNDVFGFFVNGTNCAVVSTPDGPQPVTINTINGGNPFGTNAQNPSLYRNNPSSPAPAPLNTELDGLTVVLECNATVNAAQTNHMKLAIADVGDSSYDSAVFLGAASLVSGVQITDNLTEGGQSGLQLTVPAGSQVVDTATLAGANASTATGSVTYTVYTNDTCSAVFADAGTKTVGANGVIPAANPVTVTANGTYYWQSAYSGDATHNAATSPCNGARATVTDGTATSSTSSSSTSSTSTTSSTSSTSSTSTTVGSSTSSTTVASSTSSTSSTIAGAGSTSSTVAAVTSSTKAGVAATSGRLSKTGGGLGAPFYLGLVLLGIGLILLGEGQGEPGLIADTIRRLRQAD